MSPKFCKVKVNVKFDKGSIPGAVVDITGFPPKTPDGDDCVFDLIAGQSYPIKITAKGYEPIMSSFIAGEGALDFDLEIEKKYSDQKVKVTDTEGTLLAGATVRAKAVFSSLNHEVTCITGSNGRCVLSRLRTDKFQRYEITATKPGFVSPSPVPFVPVNYLETEIAMEKEKIYVTPKFQVLDQQRKLLPNAEVSVYAVGDGVTGPNGICTLHSVVGFEKGKEYEATIKSHDYTQIQHTFVAGDQLESVVLSLAPVETQIRDFEILDKREKSIIRLESGESYVLQATLDSQKGVLQNTIITFKRDNGSVIGSGQTDNSGCASFNWAPSIKDIGRMFQITAEFTGSGRFNPTISDPVYLIT